MLFPWTGIGPRAARAALLQTLLAVFLLTRAAPGLAASCPRAASFTSAPHGTVVDLGWTGVGHGLEIGSLRFTAGLGPCATRSDGACGICPVTGLVDVTGQRRCTGDTARTCRSDADCQDAGRCRLFVRPPAPVAAGGMAWCLLASLGSHMQGSIDATDGTVSLDLPMAVQSYQGSLDSPCPLCVGDAVAADGKRDGTCDSGARRKQSCDAGSADTAKMGTPSLDCLPNAAATFGLLAGDGRSLNLTTGARVRTLDGDSPTAKTVGRAQDRALCAACENDPTRPCASNADCEEGAACGGMDGAPTAPNACDDGVCNSTDGIHGFCANGPFDRACAADPSRSCLTDSDCPAVDDDCQTSLRKCFPGDGKVGDAVGISGSADRPRGDKMQSTLAALFCVPPGRSATANQLLGLPGLGRVLVPGVWTLRTQPVEVLP